MTSRSPELETPARTAGVSLFQRSREEKSSAPLQVASKRR
ncbi:hypothetical protein HMPREF9440_01517 [Sutterella parvirubra YIT 11816]|uniref:Uncharacterized protein n=1 Tax=Sutterella parvirubra YIT 11816 TaxID=762967 RepID=H3KFJ9_9BURK|nr:hypothetical protein HMPREF9440_01517 [Sutterella parvirubra YIT 11816]